MRRQSSSYHRLVFISFQDGKCHIVIIDTIIFQALFSIFLCPIILFIAGEHWTPTHCKTFQTLFRYEFGFPTPELNNKLQCRPKTPPSGQAYHILSVMR
jgi:hypothetical protein